MPEPERIRPTVAVIGSGPGGLAAAERLAIAGLAVTIYERMPSPGRKFLMAGRGGLNLTHSEDFDTFIRRYGAASGWLAPLIRDFPPSALRAWCEDLGQPTFTGTSGRVFPQTFKASPLLRAWLARLAGLGVRFAYGEYWTGWATDGSLRFRKMDGQEHEVKASATLLALGGASWPRLGADGNWIAALRSKQIAVTPLKPANCGFILPWSAHFSARFAGQPLKPVTLTFGDTSLQGEIMVTAQGIEGGAVYALSSALRDAIEREGSAVLRLDLRPALSESDLAQRLATARGSQSLANHLRKAAGLSPLASALLRENQTTAPADAIELGAMSPTKLARRIKRCELCLSATAGIDRAISTAGGIALSALDDHLMLREMPGVFAAGEMLDWEAPTGGYLLQATFSTGIRAAKGIIAWLGWTGAP